MKECGSESKKLIDSELAKVEEIVFADSGLVMSKSTYMLEMLSGDLLMKCHHEKSKWLHFDNHQIFKRQISC